MLSTQQVVDQFGITVLLPRALAPPLVLEDQATSYKKATRRAWLSILPIVALREDKMKSLRLLVFTAISIFSSASADIIEPGFKGANSIL